MKKPAAVPTGRAVTRLHRLGITLVTVGCVVLFVTFPPASEPDETGRKYADSAPIVLGVDLVIFGLGGSCLMLAARGRARRRGILDDVEVQPFRAPWGDPRRMWVKLVDRRNGIECESRTGRTVGANLDRALDLLLAERATLAQRGAEPRG